MRLGRCVCVYVFVFCILKTPAHDVAVGRLRDAGARAGDSGNDKKRVALCEQTTIARQSSLNKTLRLRLPLSPSCDTIV